MVLTGLPSRRRMYNFTVEGTTPAGEKVVMFRTFRVGMHIVIIVAVKPYIYIHYQEDSNTYAKLLR